MWRLLLAQFDLPEAALHRVNGPVNLVRLNELIDQATDPQHGPVLRFAPYEASWPRGRLPRTGSMFERLRDNDVLLHHPFESFEPVVEFLREAVLDPDVLAIKQTIYRTGEKSVLMDLLIEAARRGKEVMVVVELKARFDEEANINWAERLEAVGAQVVYGIVGLKTHAKLLLVTRREPSPRGPRLRRYVHLSTGNYNPKTARLYTDIGYLSADDGITADADQIFQQIASLTRMKPPRHLLTAPFVLHKRLLAHIAQVRDAARAGRPARIVVKVNALTDTALIEALVRRRPGRRQHRPDRARRLLAAAGHRGADQQHPRALGGRALPGALAHRLPALGRIRRRRGAVPVQRRLDGAQHAAPHRARLADPRPGDAPAGDRRMPGALPA